MNALATNAASGTDAWHVRCCSYWRTDTRYAGKELTIVENQVNPVSLVVKIQELKRLSYRGDWQALDEILEDVRQLIIEKEKAEERLSRIDDILDRLVWERDKEDVTDGCSNPSS